MSEHKVNTTRYWKRTEPDNSVVYFLTESNASHARAEGDGRSEEIQQGEYEANVPEEARGAPYPPTAPKPNGAAASHTPAQAVEAYKAQSLAQMVNAHQSVVQLLMQANITHAERIFVLEMVKHEILQSMMAPIPTGPLPTKQ